MLETMLPLVHTGRTPLGFMKPSIWNDMYSILLDQGLLKHAFPVEKAYTLEFLRKICPELQS